jgi:hypothetical protein
VQASVDNLLLQDLVQFDEVVLQQPFLRVLEEILVGLFVRIDNHARSLRWLGKFPLALRLLILHLLFTI